MAGSSQHSSHRRFAINKVLSICGESEFGETGLRPFKVPKLNWLASKIEDLIDWDSATESILTAKLSKDEICRFLDTPFIMKPFPCHTQSVERSVKEVSIASSRVFGIEKRNGYVHARCEARKLVPKF